MKPKVYSQSLKKMKKDQGFQYSIQKINRMKREINRSEQKIKQKRIPTRSFIETRKQMIGHRISKNKIEEEVDKVMRDLVDKKLVEISNEKINKKHKYQHYRIETEPTQHNFDKQSKNNKMIMIQNRSGKKLVENRKQVADYENILPRIERSHSRAIFEKSMSKKFKTQQQLIDRLTEDPKNKRFEYINIDNVIKHYLAGMTSLIKGVYSNNHNPYIKNIPLDM